MILRKIISGGQQGADRAGLDAARALGIQTGGTAPRGWRITWYDGTEGCDPELAPLGLVEDPSSTYGPRTRRNVVDADGTILFGYAGSPGAILTLETCREFSRPCILNPSRRRFLDWLDAHRIEVLNVAGNRVSDFNPHVYWDTYAFLLDALRARPCERST